MTPTTIALEDTTAGTITLADRPVRRLGFGAMRITGPGIWGPPEDHDKAIAVLRRAVELGINLIDTANSYGPEVSENLIDEAVLDACAADGLAFIPWFPLKTGELAKAGGIVADVAQAHDATPSQVALAWLLRHSPVMLPIPGTSSVAHLE